MDGLAVCPGDLLEVAALDDALDGTIYAGLRRLRPDLEAHVLARRTMLALSHAIEDGCFARAEQPVLFGGFQRDAFLRDSYSRWVELARTALVAVVFTDSQTPRDPGPGLPVEVALPFEAPLELSEEEEESRDEA